jgi:MraZ protein
MGGHVALFISTFTNRIDKKGRVSIPAPFRTVLATQTFQGVVLFRSLGRSVLEGCGIDRLNRLSDELEKGDFIPAKANDYTSMMFAEARLLSFDGEGRVSLPEDLLQHAAIQDQITFVGRGPTFEVWDSEAFTQDHERCRQRLLSQSQEQAREQSQRQHPEQDAGQR